MKNSDISAEPLAAQEAEAGGQKARPWKRWLLPALVNACRLLLAVTFLFSGWVKANDPLGMATKLNDYLLAMGLPMLQGLPTLGASIGLALLEFTLGVALLFGLNRRLTAVVTTVVMAAMTLLTAWLALTDAVRDCGCFGDVLVLSNWQTFLKNVVLLAAALVVLRWSKMQKRLISEGASWLVSLPLMVGIVAYAVHCVRALPAVDFRPYYEGVNLREAREAAMREAGEVSLPATYKSHRRDVADFFAEDLATGEDLTDSLLAEDGPVLLLVAPRLRVADQGCVGKVNVLCDWAREQGFPFLCLTADEEAEQAKWVDYTGAEYPFAWGDELALKTMVRANPGLVLLKGGTILRKWSNWNMPSPEEVNEQIQSKTK